MAIQLLPLLLMVLGLISNIEGLLPPLARFLQQSQNNLIPNQIPDASTLLDLLRKNHIEPEMFKNTMAKLGFNSEWQNILTKLTAQYPVIDEYIKLFRRGEIPATRLWERGAREGFDKQALDELLKATEYFPQPQDLIRFAIREVYTPDIVSKFGMFEDLPQQYLNEASKAGLPEEQAKNYWAAHWQLPSPLMGFDMFHRRIIDQTELEQLLKALDVMPFWREKLVQLSYNPLTRVDVRRMYELGVLNLEEVYNAYLDDGYSPVNAERLTKFTELYYNDEIEGITRAQIMNGFVEGILSLDEMIEWLKQLGESEEVRAFHAQQAIYEKTIKDINYKKNAYTEQYRLGMLDLNQVRSELFKEGLPSTYVENVINDLILDKASKASIPTKSDANDWMGKGLINENEYVNILRRLGYNDKDITLYLAEYAIDNDTTRKKYLKDDIYIRWFKRGYMSYDDFYTVMSEKGISDQDINLIIAELQGGENET
jgi:Ca2+-binding EF-hand superfamily protein